MLDKPARRPRAASKDGWPLYKVWKQYEEIAMHFNDLLIRLRIQALAGVAALSTAVSIFVKADPNGGTPNWQMATGVFFGLCMFWIAIWILDFRYYHRLLIGAVAALLSVEKLSETQTRIHSIQMSTIIERSVAGSLKDRKKVSLRERTNLRLGIWSFYTIVLVALFVGFAFSFHKWTGYIPTWPEWVVHAT